MSAQSTIQRLQHIFKSKENFEREFLLHSLRAENYSLLKEAFAESNFSEEYKQKIKKCIAGSFFNASIKSSLKEIEKNINDKLDTPVEIKSKIVYLENYITEFNILFASAIRSIEGYPEINLNDSELHDIEKLNDTLKSHSKPIYDTLHKMFGFATPDANEYIQNMRNVIEKDMTFLKQSINNSGDVVNEMLNSPVLSSEYFNPVIYEAIIDIYNSTLYIAAQKLHLSEQLPHAREKKEKPKSFEELFESIEIANEILSILIKERIINEQFEWKGFEGVQAEVRALQDALITKGYISKWDRSLSGRLLCQKFKLNLSNRMFTGDVTQAYNNTIEKYESIIPEYKSLFS